MTQYPPPARPYVEMPDRRYQPMRNGLGIAALVLGIVGLVFGLIPLIFFIAWVCGVLGLIFGLVGIRRVGRREADNRGMAIAGTICSVLAIGLGVVGVVIINEVFEDTEEALDELERDIDEAFGLPDSAGPCSEVWAPGAIAPRNAADVTCTNDAGDVTFSIVAHFSDNGKRYLEWNEWGWWCTSDRVVRAFTDEQSPTLKQQQSCR